MPWKPFSRKREGFKEAFKRTAEKFGLQVIKMNKEEAEVVYGEEEFGVGLENARDQWTNLDAQDRDSYMDYFFKSMIEAVSADHSLPLEDARDLLMPMLRVPFPDKLDEETKVPVGRPFLEDLLRIFVVVDSPTSMSYVSEDELERWSASFEDLYAIALENLRRSTSPANLSTREDFPGIQGLSLGDGYDATRVLLVKDLVSSWPSEGIVASVPYRDHLMFVELNSANDLEPMHTMIKVGAAMYRREAYAVTDQPIWFDGEIWERIPLLQRKKGLSVIPKERFTGALERLCADK